jgi:protein-S-isoprenylcysteine O-methyltransferase Ste14
LIVSTHIPFLPIAPNRVDLLQLLKMPDDSEEVPRRRSLKFALRQSLIPLGKIVFANRLLLGLFVVAIAGLFVRPVFPGSLEEAIVTGISVILVIAGVILRAWAAGYAGNHTRTSNIEAGKLATNGPYAFVRNPIYLGSIVLGIGMVGIIGDWRLSPLCAATFTALYFVIIPAEEEFLHREYPLEYKIYCRNVRRLLPRFRPWPGAERTSFAWQPALGEWQTVVILASILAFLYGVAFLRGAQHF